MSSNTRSSRRTTVSGPSSSVKSTPPPTQPDISSLTTLECLIIAQAVYEYGADSWPAIAKMLSKHPLLSRPKSFFTPQSCLAIYNHLMKEANLDCSEANNASHAQANLTLAQRHYRARLFELRELILAEEAKFQRVVAEIDEIRAGKWDDKTKAKHDGTQEPSQEPKEPMSQEETSREDLNLQTMVLPDQSKTVEPSGFSAKTKTPDHFAVPLNRRLEAEEEEEEEDEGERERELVGAATAPVLQEQIMSDELPNLALPSSPTPQVGQKQALPDQLAPRPSDSMPTIAVRPDIPKLERQDSTMEIEEVQSARSPSYTSGETNRNRKRKASDAEGVSPSPVREAKRHREESEPAEEEDQGPSSGQTRKRRPTGTSDRVADKRFQNVIGMLHSQISQHRNGNIFHNPIKNSEAPDYHEIIKRPMDLKSIKAKIKDGVISTSLEFQRDVYLMFANAMMYNRPGSDIYHMAEDMMIESEVHINTFRQTEGFVRSTHR